MLAATTNDHAVIVAVLGLLGVIGAALIAGAVQMLLTHRRLGKPNGGGTVVGEIELVKKAVRDAAETAQVAADAAANAASIAATSARLAAAISEANGTKIEELATRVQAVETELNLIPRQPF